MKKDNWFRLSPETQHAIRETWEADDREPLDGVSVVDGEETRPRRKPARVVPVDEMLLFGGDE